MVPVRGVECAAAELFAAVDRRIGRSMQLANRRYQDVGLRAFAVAEFEMPAAVRLVEHGAAPRLVEAHVRQQTAQLGDVVQIREDFRLASEDRKSVVEGKSVSVRVDLGGSRILKKQAKKRTN